MSVEQKFYVTTPIYYGTAKPHLGSLYSTVIADVFARWHRLYNHKTMFVTGTDEHGQKVAQAAHKAGKAPQEFVDTCVKEYTAMWKEYAISYDTFIRTTDEKHKHAVQEWIKQAQERGDIYKSLYSGWYCTPCETYVTHDLDIKEAPLCSTCQRETNKISEESYFFKLSAYQDKLLRFYEENPSFIVPKERLAEVVSFVKSGLQDLSISRTTVQWGVPFPGDAKHTVYVWADALINYISAVGYADSTQKKAFDVWWPADMHVLGKDIVRFHAVYWPAFLMAVGLQLPKRLLVHGWIKVNQQKMSKSFGNVVDPELLRTKYGVDEVRYYLMRHMTITHDSEFSTMDLEQRITSDLANDLGNLLNRTVTLALKNNVSQVRAQKVWSQISEELRQEAWKTLDEYEQCMREGVIHQALGRLWQFIHQVNSYFHTNEPWKQAKKDDVLFAEIISATCHSLYIIATLLSPVMPAKMKELLHHLGHEFTANKDYIADLKHNRWDREFNLQLAEKSLFAKHEPEEQKKEVEPIGKKEDATEHIIIDDVVRVELRVGGIVSCQTVEKSDKLLKMHVDFGELGSRTILAGIRQHYKPEELVNKQALFVTNLKPRMMLGIESQGMMLLAKDETGKLVIMQPAHVVANGTRLQ